MLFDVHFKRYSRVRACIYVAYFIHMYRIKKKKTGKVENALPEWYLNIRRFYALIDTHSFEPFKERVNKCQTYFFFLQN